MDVEHNKDSPPTSVEMNLIDIYMLTCFSRELEDIFKGCVYYYITES